MVDRRLRRTPTKRDLIVFVLMIATAAAVLYFNRDTQRAPVHPRSTAPLGTHAPTN